MILNLIKLYLLDIKAKNSLADFANEYKTINEILEKIGIAPLKKEKERERERAVVDIAASDGFSQSCTLGFYRRGYGGLAVEMEPIKFATLSFLYRNFENVRLMRVRVTPDNVASILSAAEIRKDSFTILNLDIDSYDLHVVKAILSAGYRPTIISMEINEKIPSGIHFTVDYDINHYWQGDHFYGCSIDAAYNTVIPYGYILYKVNYNNAFFVNTSHTDVLLNPLLPAEAYAEGYRYKKDIKELFPWNKDVDYWQELSKKEAVIEIKKYFFKYKDKFTIFKCEQ